MTTAADNPVPGRAAAKRRRYRLPVLLLLGAVLAAGLVWYGRRWYVAPVPPEVPLAGADPALVRAVEDLRLAVRGRPYSAAAWGELGQLLYASDYHEQAAVCFARAERLDAAEPRWPYLWGECLVQRDPDAALPHLRRGVELSDGSDPAGAAARLELAEVLLGRGQYDEAEAEVRRVPAAAAAADPRAQLDLGRIAYARGGDLEGSRAHLLRCRASPFTRKKACAQLAAVAQRLGDPAAAERFTRQAEALPPDLSYLDPFIQECLRLAVGPRSRLRRAEQLEAQGRYRDAVAELQALAAQRPDYPTCVQLGKNLAQVGDYADAEQALRTAVRIEPDSAVAYYYLSKLTWAQAEARRKGGDPGLDRFREAADLARRAVERKPDYALAHMVLGVCSQRLGNRPEALAELRRAVECRPELAEPHLHLGTVLAEAGRPDEARRELQQAAQLAGPEDARPRQELERLGKKNIERPTSNVQHPREGS